MSVFKVLIFVLFLQSSNVYAENEAAQSACLKEEGVIRCFNEYRKKVEEKSSRLAYYFSKEIVEGWIYFISGDMTKKQLMHSLRSVRSRSTFARRMCEIHDMRYDVQTDSSGRLHILSSSCSNGDYRMTIVDYKKENGRYAMRSWTRR